MCCPANSPVPVGQVIAGRRLSGIYLVVFLKRAFKSHVLPGIQNGSFNHTHQSGIVQCEFAFPFVAYCDYLFFLSNVAS